MAAAAAEGSVPEEPIDVASVDIEPNQCPLESPLSVGIRFRSKVAIGNPSWTCQVRAMASVARCRVPVANTCCVCVCV